MIGSRSIASPSSPQQQFGQTITPQLSSGGIDPKPAGKRPQLGPNQRASLVALNRRISIQRRGDIRKLDTVFHFEAPHAARQ
jgi:hypothetical protein